MRTRFIKPFIDILKSPRGLWYIIGAFVVDSMAYFGILTLMVTYFSKGLEWPDKYASITVSVFTMLVTLFMLGGGKGGGKERFRTEPVYGCCQVE